MIHPATLKDGKATRRKKHFSLTVSLNNLTCKRHSNNPNTSDVKTHNRPRRWRHTHNVKSGLRYPVRKMAAVYSYWLPYRTVRRLHVKKSQLINKRAHFRHFIALSAMLNFRLAVLVQVDAIGAHSKH